MRNVFTFGVGVWLVLSVFGCSGSDNDEENVPSGSDTGVDTGVTVTDSGTADSSGGDTSVDSATDTGPSDGGFFTAAELTELGKLLPLPAVPPDTTNKVADDAAAATLGQMLFFDKSYSGPLAVGDDGTNGGLGAVGESGKIACASCHGGPTMDDTRSKPNNVSLGADWLGRNTLSLVNSSYYKWTNWAGRFDSQWSLPLAVAENGKNMNSNRLKIAHMLYAKYKTEYNTIFTPALDPRLDPAHASASELPASGKPGEAAWDTGTNGTDKDIINRIYSNYGKALAAYIRKLVSKNAPFDKFLMGDNAAISLEAKRGLKVFLGKGKCITCHSGPNFSDDAFHALGLQQTGPHVPAADDGRFADVPPLLSSIFNSNGNYSDDKTTGRLTGLVADGPTQTGKFRTKSLRGVSSSGPYMHAGQLATLEDVVQYYAKGGILDAGDAGVPDTGADGGTVVRDIAPFSLEGTDAADLVAFMKTLVGEPVPTALTMNTAK